MLDWIHDRSIDYFNVIFSILKYTRVDLETKLLMSYVNEDLVIL